MNRLSELSKVDQVMILRYYGLMPSEIRDMTGISVGYSNSVFKKYPKGWEWMAWFGRLERKTIKDLVRGKMIGEYQFHRFFKGPQDERWMEGCLDRGKGKLHRINWEDLGFDGVIGYWYDEPV